MSYPFVAAKYFTPGGMTQPRGMVIHMAEGGGTVSWLHNGPYIIVNGVKVPQDNSSHFVVEYSGRIVQMVKDGDASHSLHLDPRPAEPGPGDYGIFSANAAKAVLGDGWPNPNRYIFAVEVEGFAESGPSAIQVAALTRLIADLRTRHPSLRGNLGHRDFQDYKPCPGGRVPWDTLGGHGLYSTAPVPAPEPTPLPPEEPAMPYLANVKPLSGIFTTQPGGATVYWCSNGQSGPVGGNEEQTVVLEGDLVGVIEDAYIALANGLLYAYPKGDGAFVAAPADAAETRRAQYDVDARALLGPRP